MRLSSFKGLLKGFYKGSIGVFTGLPKGLYKGSIGV